MSGRICDCIAPEEGGEVACRGVAYCRREHRSWPHPGTSPVPLDDEPAFTSVDLNERRLAVGAAREVIPAQVAVCGSMGSMSIQTSR